MVQIGAQHLQNFRVREGVSPLARESNAQNVGERAVAISGDDALGDGVAIGAVGVLAMKVVVQPVRGVDRVAVPSLDAGPDGDERR